ncbi:MAG: CinA family protein [Rhizobiaceae bacterium]|nr:CinA family protein [Rhizobiaceae bacterium]
MSKAAEIITKYTEAELMIATAESCTGGLIAGALTDIAGSSSVVDRGFVTYSNEAKMDMLGVSSKTLDAHGAVSEQTAREMAVGALVNSRADVSVAVTGIAGPGGGSDEKPVGLVYMGVANNDGVQTYKLLLGADKTRDEIRQATVERALNELLMVID